MALEATPTSVPTTGNVRITFVPSSGNPLSVAILGGATAKDLTYSLTPTGWNPAIAENSIADGRLAQKQILNQPGTFSETLEVTYVYGDTADVAKPALAEGTLGFIVVRDSIPNGTAWTASTQKVDVFTIKAGKQRKNPYAENALQTITQTLYLTAPTQRDAALAA